jgi:O-antigen biosynthesis protein
LFPKSKRFNKYYLGNLSNHETHEIEILSGAFMFMRKAALDQVGLLDEAFFMYGEDIDLSWRIIQGGWKNYYFPETSIIHYKGESTKKGSLNYVYVFYNAMVIFAKKHFSASHATTFSFFIQLAIWMRASLSIVKRFISAASLPVLDSLVLFFGVKFFADTYSVWKMKNFEENLVEASAFGFAVLTWFFNWLSGAYDKPLIPKRSLKPIFWVTLLTLVVYSLLPEQVRFSRLVVLMSAGLAFLSIPLVHYLYKGITTRKWNWRSQTAKRILIAGSDDEAQRVEDFLKQIHYPVASFVRLKATDAAELADLNEWVRIHRIHEVIFCGKDLSSSTIIGAMSQFSHLEVEYKIAPPERHFIIGSQQIQSANDTFFVEVNSIGTKLNKRQKRAFDVASSLVLLSVFPVLFVTTAPGKRIVACLEVLFGKKSWIGYYGNQTKDLPNIRSGVFSPNKNAGFLNEEGVQQMNALYAKDYSWWKDLRLLQQLF